MYAVFQVGSKQYFASEHELICMERLNVSVGDQIKFNQILVIKDDNFLQLGNPFIQNWVVVATVVTHGFAKKIKIVKFHRRKHFRKHQGHRQQFTKIKISSISIV